MNLSVFRVAWLLAPAVPFESESSVRHLEVTLEHALTLSSGQDVQPHPIHRARCPLVVNALEYPYMRSLSGWETY